MDLSPFPSFPRRGSCNLVTHMGNSVGRWEGDTRSQGFGAADVVMLRAASLEGPGSTPQKIYRPPESDGRNPFVYAGKAQPELRGADLVIT